MFSLEIVSTIVFFVIVGILVIRDRKNLEFQYGVIVRRWRKGQAIIDKLVRKHKRAISIIGNIGVIVGVLAGILGFAFLVQFTFRLQQAFYLVLPSVSGITYPGPVVSIPFWYWLIGVFVIIAAHESMHAIYSRLEKIPIKSYGVLLLLVLPIGAFVDPDMKKITKLKFLGKLRIYAAGSFANFITAAAMFLITLVISTFLFAPSGVEFNQLINGTPAYSVNMSGTIIGINDGAIKTEEDLSTVFSQIKAGDRINIRTTEGNYVINTVGRPENESVAYIGISGIRVVFDVKPELQNFKGLINAFNNLVFWLFLLSAGVGIANMLPIKPLDGGLIFEEIFNKIFKSNGKIATKIISFVTIALILFNLFGISLIKFIF
jgi:membrane-associated protease RseP (regulator of RpoE activity)